MKKQFRITLNGKSYEVVAELLDDGPAASETPASRTSARANSVKAMATPAKAAPPPAAGEGAVLSPLAGKVVSIDVEVGNEVRPGQRVITLEAMKMNTVVSATVEGTVSAIKVKSGDSVEEGQLLLVIV
jgi:biotin carboxyl carrier protein